MAATKKGKIAGSTHKKDNKGTELQRTSTNDPKKYYTTSIAEIEEARTRHEISRSASADILRVFLLTCPTQSNPFY